MAPCATWGVRRLANPSGEEVGTRSSRLRRRVHFGAGRRASRAADRLRTRKEHESCDSALRCWCICSAIVLAVVPAAAGDEPATLETLPASQADERLADLGVPASDIPEAVEVLDEARSDPDAEIVGDSVVWDDGAVELQFVSPMALADCPSGRTCLWENASYGGRDDQLHGHQHACSTSGPSGWVNRASSWANKRAGDAQLGTPGPASNWGSASKLCLQANSQAASMGGWDNAADLVRLCDQQRHLLSAATALSRGHTVPH